jgi:hypothetical protein
MRRSFAVLLLCLVSVSFAQDSVGFFNSIGWESGLSYRRYVRKDMWLGVNLSGSYSRSTSRETQLDSTSITDTLQVGSIGGVDTAVTYSGAIKIEFGKQLFRFKRLNIDLLLALGYSASDSKSDRPNEVSTNPKLSGNYGYLNDQMRQSFLAIVGLEPKIFLWDRISVGTQFGLQYTYSYTTDKYNNGNSTSTNVEGHYDNTSTLAHALAVFGNVSLTSGLIVHFYF